MASLLALRFAHGLVLLALPLALAPLFHHPADLTRFSWNGLIPADPAAEWVLRLQRLAAAAAIAAIVLGLAGPYRSAHTVERVGRGSEIVLVLDRSLSMDQPFVNRQRTINPYYQESDQQDVLHPGGEAKGRVARRALAAFAAGRTHDLIAYIVFSGFPIRVLDFTQNQDMVQAAILAGDVGRGLADTDIGRALLAAAELWRERPWRGSRTVVLVSDGGAQLDEDMRARLAYALRRHHVGVNFLYIRSYNSHGLNEKITDADAANIPEISLHRYLGSLGIPYHAYEADNAAELRRAVADIGERENTPLVYDETLPRHDYAARCFALALLAALIWLFALQPNWRPPWMRSRA